MTAQATIYLASATTLAGAADGAEFQVNATANDEQWVSTTAGLTDGGFVVTWTSNNQDGDGYGIYGQRYDAAGAAAGAEFQINTYTAGDQQFADVTAASRWWICRHLDVERSGW